MSKDNVLKKQFQERDVQRLRNLVQGKYGEKTRSSVGFTKADEFHEEGDIWESDGRKWTIKDGIKQNITKLDEAKKAHVMPLLCPKCKHIMKKRNDKTFYNIHKMCFDCVIDFEHDLKKQGKWEDVIESFKYGEFQLLHSANRDAERDQYGLFSPPYLTMPIVNFGRVVSPRINSIEDLKNRKIGVVSSFTITKKL